MKTRTLLAVFLLFVFLLDAFSSFGYFNVAPNLEKSCVLQDSKSTVYPSFKSGCRDSYRITSICFDDELKYNDEDDDDNKKEKISFSLDFLHFISIRPTIIYFIANNENLKIGFPHFNLYLLFNQILI